MRKPLIGLLPLYVELYDLTTPEVRPDIDAFHDAVSERLRKIGLDVINAPVCRLSAEFREAVSIFEDEKVDAIVTIHLAYSPSLESESALKLTKLPIIVLDTTPEFVFDQHTPDSAIMLNHGIHGVQDMCNLLIRNEKIFTICAGHMDHSNVLDRVMTAAKAAMIANSLKTARVGIVGKSFSGMGDFLIPLDVLKREIGIDVITYDFTKAAQYIKQITQEQLDEEYNSDCEYFNIDSNLTREVYDRTARTSLTVRRWIHEKNLTALTINFLETEGSPEGMSIMPFTECSKAMVKGIGYAGEGDVLTSAFVGALLTVFEKTTFAEMFCPDWAHSSVFLSHMGEFNYKISSSKPFLTEKPFPYTNAENPTVAYSPMQAGKAMLVNFAPFGCGRYKLILASGEMISVEGENELCNSVNGWFKPNVEISDFLEQFSMAGGTHHSAIIYGEPLDELKLVAKFLGIELCVIA